MTTIHPAAPSDLGFLWEMLWRASHSDQQAGVSVDDIKRDPVVSRYLDGWGRPTDVALIAREDDVNLGACWHRHYLPSEYDDATFVDPATPELVIAVQPKAIGTGVGSALLRELLQRADHAGIPAVVLNVRSDNPAKRLYERHGFGSIGTIPNRVGGVSHKMLRTAGATTV